MAKQTFSITLNGQLVTRTSKSHTYAFAAVVIYDDGAQVVGWAKDAKGAQATARSQAGKKIAFNRWARKHETLAWYPTAIVPVGGELAI